MVTATPCNDTGITPASLAWDNVTVGSLARFSSGQGVSISALHGYSADYPVPVYGGNGIAGYTNTPLVTQPTVVIGRVGQRCGEVYVTDGPCWVTDNALYPVRILRPMDMQFFGLALSAARLNDVKNRNDLPLVTQSILHAVHVAWPSDVNEQRAIAAALTDVDALLGSLDRLLSKKRDLKQAATQQLLSGQRRLPGFEGEWKKKRLGEVTAIRNEKVMPSNVAPETLCVELEHIGQGNGRLLARAEAQHSTSSKYRFVPGDVLFGRLRSYLRKYWLADRAGICSTEIWPLIADSTQVVSGFLYALIQSDRFIDAATMSYGTHMPRADWGALRNFKMLCPEVDEQAAIAEIVTDMEAEIAALEQRRDKARALKLAMMQELLTGRIRLL